MKWKAKLIQKPTQTLKNQHPRRLKRHEEQIAGCSGSLNDPFYGAAQKKAAGVEIPGTIINGLISARKYGTERVEQSIKKKLLFREVSFYAVL